jgi:hypothetical protein
MKVLDQMSGLKASAGDPATHLAFLIGLSIVAANNLCRGGITADQLHFLILTHALNAFRIVIRTLAMQWSVVRPNWRYRLEMGMRIYRIGCIIINLWTTMTVQDQFFSGTKDEMCTEKEAGIAHKVFLLEISFFYA